MTSHSSSGLHYRAFLVLLVVTTAFRLFYIQQIELAPDEAYYWTWARHLQWGYYDHPSMTGFLIWISTTLAGQGEFGVRVVWVLMGAMVSFLLYLTGKMMFRSERAGFYSALLMNVILLASAGAIVATPDGPQALFWVLAVFCVFQAVSGKGVRWWYFTGISLGLGLLSKYTMILIAPCILFFLLSSPEGRGWLSRKEPYLALLLGLVIFFPVILWNAQNDWISFRFQLSHGLAAKKAAGLRYFGEYWAGQAGVISPLMFLALLWAMAKSALQGFRLKKNHLLLLFWTSAPILLFFAYTSLRSRVEANWPAPAYFSAVIALAGISSAEWPGWKIGKRALAWAACVSAFLFTLAAHVQPIHAVVPIRPAKDPTSQVRGWRGLGDRLQEAAGPEKGVFLITPRHQLVGEGMFYTRGKIPIYQWDAPHRIQNLSPANSPPAGSQAVFFSEGGNEIPKNLEALFDSCEKLEPYVVRRNSSVIRTHPIWKCTGFKGLRGTDNKK